MTMDVATNPRGLFDRSTIGFATRPVTVQVERGRIRFLAQVLGFTDPIHNDVDAARAAGHPDLVAPPSFVQVVDGAANEELRRRGEPTASATIGSDVRYLLHGEERYLVEGLLYAGDEVEVSTTVLNFFDKKGGAMEFVELETAVRHAKRGLLVRSRRTLLHRLPTT
jgi:hypothetical protein